MATEGWTLTETRRTMAQHVADGHVVYFDAEALPWRINGEPVGGWDGRTLREMRSDGLLDIGGGDDTTGLAVTLTDVGRDSLARSTPPTES